MGDAEDRVEEQDVIEDEARDDARADRYDDTAIREMLSNVLEKLDSLAEGMKALFVSSPAKVTVEDEEDEEDEVSYSLDDLDL